MQAQFTIVPAGAEAKFTVELEYTTVEYDGTAKEPAVTVKDGTTVLTKDVDYTVAYENNVNAGTATVVVTGMNNYSGTKTATFTITRTVFAIEAEDAENGTDVAGVTVDVTILDETAKTLRIDDLNVPAAAAGHLHPRHTGRLRGDRDCRRRHHGDQCDRHLPARHGETYRD